MARQAEMFEKPKRKPRVVAHMIDAGNFPDGRMAAHFACCRCEWAEWLAVENATEARRGHACPKCNSH